jgi:hypothetical protein
VLDGPQNGRIPEPWDVHVVPDQQFVSAIRKTPIPHTEQMMACFRCNSFGNLKCSGIKYAIKFGIVVFYLFFLQDVVVMEKKIAFSVMVLVFNIKLILKGRWKE